MNLIHKSRMFLSLKRQGVTWKGSLYSFNYPLTRGDKLAIGLIVLVVIGVWG